MTQVTIMKADLIAHKEKIFFIPAKRSSDEAFIFSFQHRTIEAYFSFIFTIVFPFLCSVNFSLELVDARLQLMNFGSFSVHLEIITNKVI